MTETFTRADVIAKTGVEPRQIAHWSNIGVIAPEIRQSSGPGDRRLFSSRNLIQARIGVLMARFKIPAPMIEEALRSAPPGELERAGWLVWSHSSPPVFFSSADEQFIARDFEAVLVIDLEHVRRTVGVATIDEHGVG